MSAKVCARVCAVCDGVRGDVRRRGAHPRDEVLDVGLGRHEVSQRRAGRRLKHLVAGSAVKDEADLASLGFVHKKQSDAAFRSDSDAEKLDAQESLDKTNQSASVPPEKRVKVRLDQITVVDDGLTIGI